MPHVRELSDEQRQSTRVFLNGVHQKFCFAYEEGVRGWVDCYVPFRPEEEYETVSGAVVQVDPDTGDCKTIRKHGVVVVTVQ